MKPSLRLFGVLLAAVLLVQCRKEKTVTADVDLQNLKPAEIQSALAGRWELKRISGGLCNFCEHPVTHHPYMVLTANNVTFGNDSLGITEQGPITWISGSYMGYTHAFTTPSGNSYVPLQIQNDTLRMLQYAIDGVAYHYTRN